MFVRIIHKGNPLAIRTLDVKDEQDCQRIIEQAALIIRSGGLVVYPTDTSYGLGCDPTNIEAMEKLYVAKRRDHKLGVPLLFTDLEQCEVYHEFFDLEKIIARLFWPGALTLVVTVRETVPGHITAGRGSLAVRVPNHFIPREIARNIGGPIVGTSANISGGPSPFEISDAIKQLGDEVELYIDGGKSTSTKNSTIVGVEEVDESGIVNIKVYREGQIDIDELTEGLMTDAEAQRFSTTRVVLADR